MLTISQIDHEVDYLIEHYHIYGVECLINSIVRCSEYEYYLNEASMIALTKSAFERLYFKNEKEGEK